MGALKGLEDGTRIKVLSVTCSGVRVVQLDREAAGGVLRGRQVGDAVHHLLHRCSRHGSHQQLRHRYSLYAHPRSSGECAHAW